MNKSQPTLPKAIVMGASAGGVSALKTILCQLDAAFSLPIVIALHLSPNTPSRLAALLDQACALSVKEAEEGEALCDGTVYLAAANYHLLVETNGTLSFSVDARVCFSRPSIDILFESAAAAFGKQLIAVILSGANQDGSAGIKKVAEFGGITLVQDPAEAEMPDMPLAALKAIQADYTLPLSALGSLLNQFGAKRERKEHHHAIG